MARFTRAPLGVAALVAALLAVALADAVPRSTSSDAAPAPASAAASGSPSTKALAAKPGAAPVGGVMWLAGCSEASLFSPSCGLARHGKAFGGDAAALPLLPPRWALHTSLVVAHADSASPFAPLLARVAVVAPLRAASSPCVYFFRADRAAFDFGAPHSVAQAVAAAEAAGPLHVRPCGDATASACVEVEVPGPGAWRVLFVSPPNEAELALDAFVVEVGAWPSSKHDTAPLSVAQLAGVTWLTPGVEVRGSLAWATQTVYGLNVTIPFQRVDVTVTPSYGDPDLFVALDGITPTRNHYQYRSINFVGSDVVVVRQTDANNRAAFYCNATSMAGQNCVVLAAVWNANFFVGMPANYSIVMTPGGTSSPLQPGMPRLDQVAARDSNYYSFAPSVAGGTLTFAVTPFAGDPDVYIASSIRGSQRPAPGDPSSYCWSSLSTGRDVVEIFPDDATGCYCGNLVSPACSYYVSVYGFPPVTATYTIVVTEGVNTTIELVDGVPQDGFVSQGQTDQYALVAAGLATATASRRISISLSSFAGDVDAYVTLDGSTPGRSNWLYRSLESAGLDYIAIRSSDAAVQSSPCADSRADCLVRVAVYGYSAGISWYELTASSGRALVLADGAEVSDFVDQGEFVYFTFTVDDPATAVIVTVTPTSGDPDVFISNNVTAAWPTDQRGTWQWSGQGTGVEIVYIEPTDPNMAVCRLGPCVFVIGVQGYGNNASFVIVARTRDGRPTALVPMTPIFGYVDVGIYDRYTAFFDRSVGMLEITVTPLDGGDADLYIALDNRFVTRSNWSYASTHDAGVSEDIVIRNTDRAFNLSATCGGAPAAGLRLPCTASIAVYGYSAASYAITSSTGVKVLIDGVPVDGAAPANGFTYFVYTQVNRFAPLFIAVDPTTNDPDVFVSTTRWPNRTSYMWSAQGLGPELLTIDPADPRARACAMPCTFYIGVYGYMRPTLFSVSASAASSGFLTPGRAVPGYAAPGLVFAYWSFLAPLVSPGGIEFSLMPTSGAPDTQIFVGNALDPATGRTLYPALQCSDPACLTYVVANAFWASGQSLARNEVQVSSSDAAWRPRALYIVGVLSESGASFQILGAAGNSVKTLSDGVPVSGAVATGQYSYYRLPSTTWGAGLMITVTPMSGDPDLYVSSNSSNPRPDSRHYDKSSVGSSVDQVLFQWAELSECQQNISPDGSDAGFCSLFVGVFGWSNATFTIVGDVVPANASSMTELADGQPQAASLAAGTWAFFYATVSLPPTATYSVYVRAISGDPDLYVTTDGLGPPSLQYYQYRSTHASGDDFVNVAPGTAGYNSSTRMVAGVYAYFAATAFEITYSSNSAVVALVPGVASSGVVAAGQYAYYSFAAPVPSLKTTFVVTALSGDPDIYIGVWRPLSQRYRPTTQSWTWKGENEGSDTVTILPTDPAACVVACNYIAGVYCSSPSGSCRYTVSAAQGSALTQLQDGQPAAGSVGLGNVAYFSFALPASGRRNVTVRTAATLGTAQIFVTAAYDPLCRPGAGVTCAPLPVPGSPSTYSWASSRDGGVTGSGAVTIGASDPLLPPNATARGALFTIGVVGGLFAPLNLFSIVAATAEVVTALVPGQASLGNTVAAGSNAHFSIYMGDLTQDLIVAVSVLQGSVVFVAASPWRPLPSCSAPRTCNATWTSVVAAQPTNALRIYAPKSPTIGPCLGPYVVSGGPWPCVASRDWLLGQYGIGVFGVTDSVYSITAYTSSAYQNLDSGVPQPGMTAPGCPAVFLYNVARGGNSLPDKRFVVASDVQPLVFYIRSCQRSRCTAADQTPSPTNYQDSGSVASGQTIDFFITRFSPSNCVPPTSGSDSCAFFIAVYVAGACTDPANPACTATLTVTANVQDGGMPTLVSFSSIANKVFSLNGNVAAGTSAIIELFLNNSVAAAPANIQLDLDACGPGLPSLYVCRQNPAAGVAPCSNPFLPQPGTGTGGNTAAASTAAGPVVGSVRLTDVGVAGQSYFLAIAADGAGPGGGAVTWAAYNIAMSSGVGALYLQPPASVATLVAPDADGTSVNVSWTPAAVAAPGGAAVDAKLAQYYVYFAAGGFASNGNPQNLVATTACGLIRGAAVLSTDPAGPTARGTLWVSVTGLNPDTYYEFAVLAQCDAACFAAVGSQLQRGSDGSLDVPGAGVPGYATQRTSFPVVSATTSGGSGPPSAISSDLGPAGIAAVSGGVGLCALVLLLGWCYRSRKRDDFANQYASLSVDNAMATISTPVSGLGSVQGGGGANGASGGGGGAGAGGGGFLSPLRNLMRGRGGGPGYEKASLAAAEDAGFVDDRAAGYL